jgi:hypothetical protein
MKLYIVNDDIQEKAIAVFSTEEAADTCRERLEREGLAKGYDVVDMILRFTYDEYELDKDPEDVWF